MKKQLADIAVSDTGFVFDPSTGQTFLLNKTGLRIVRMLQEGYEIDKTVGILEDEFEITKKDALEDVKEFLSLMKDKGFQIDDIEA